MSRAQTAKGFDFNVSGINRSVDLKIPSTVPPANTTTTVALYAVPVGKMAIVEWIYMEMDAQTGTTFNCRVRGSAIVYPFNSSATGIVFFTQNAHITLVAGDEVTFLVSTSASPAGVRVNALICEIDL